MLARVIFCVVVAAAVLAVILLATVSPIPHRAGSGGGQKDSPGTRTFTVYVHPAASAAEQANERGRGAARRGEASAPVFHHRMTAGPESSSRTVGVASGFLLLPAGERGASAAVFDTVHLAFDGAAGMSGSLCVEAGSTNGRPGKRGRGADEEEVLQVVGGTGAFAFAHGHAVVRRQRPGHGATAAAAALLLEISVSSGGS